MCRPGLGHFAWAQLEISATVSNPPASLAGAMFPLGAVALLVIAVWLFKRHQSQGSGRRLDEAQRAGPARDAGSLPSQPDEMTAITTGRIIGPDAAPLIPTEQTRASDANTRETAATVLLAPQLAFAELQELERGLKPTVANEARGAAAWKNEPALSVNIAEAVAEPRGTDLRSTVTKTEVDHDERIEENGSTQTAEENAGVRSCSVPGSAALIPANGNGPADQQPADNAVPPAELRAAQPDHAVAKTEAILGWEPEPSAQAPEHPEADSIDVKAHDVGLEVGPTWSAGQAETAEPPVPPGRVSDADDEVAPSVYRPPLQGRPRHTSLRSECSERSTRSSAVLEIRVRMTLDRHGYCRISLLPERRQGMDDQITVNVGPLRLELDAQEAWYSDIYFDDIGERLRRGIRCGGLLTSGQRVEWQLSRGRKIYVLAGYPSAASGFISVPRLALGRAHAVLCCNDVLEQAEAILKQAGCSGYTKLDSSHGVPDGWAGFRDVLPESALALGPGTDPFYALKPAPDIEISLEGGLLFHDAVWLAGYPPQIKITGQTTGALRVLIDGQEARAADGCYAAAGFDALGRHLVECEGLSCSRAYSIDEPAESWERWEAYAFSGSSVCGPLVTPGPETPRGRIFTVPTSNPLLLGAEPGQIFRCSHRIGATWQGFVPFEVVWALPAQPLMCDKTTARILFYSSAPTAAVKRNASLALSWCTAILDACRKGLCIESGFPDSAARWIEYKKAARNIWRSIR